MRPIDMVLHCPCCGVQHIDAPARDSHGMCDVCKAPPAAPCYRHCSVWNNPSHRSHLCSACGHIWRPADVPTNGVEAVKTTGQNDSPTMRRYVFASAPGVPIDTVLVSRLWCNHCRRNDHSDAECPLCITIKLEGLV